EINVNRAASAARPGTRSALAARTVRSVNRQACRTGAGQRAYSDRTRRSSADRAAPTAPRDRSVCTSRSTAGGSTPDSAAEERHHGIGERVVVVAGGGVAGRGQFDELRGRHLR